MTVSAWNPSSDCLFNADPTDRCDHESCAANRAASDPKGPTMTRPEPTADVTADVTDPTVTADPQEDVTVTDPTVTADPTADPQEDVTVTDPTADPTADVTVTAEPTADPLTVAIENAFVLADPATGTVPLAAIDAVRVLTRKASDRARASAILNAATMSALTAVPADVPRATAAASIGHAITVTDAPSDPIADAVRAYLTFRYDAEDVILNLTDPTVAAKVRSAVDAALTADPTRPDGFVPAKVRRTSSGTGSSSGTGTGARSAAGIVPRHVLLTVPADGTAVTLGSLAKAVSGMVREDGSEYHPKASAIRQALDNGSIPGCVREDVNVPLKDGSANMVVGLKVLNPAEFVRPNLTDPTADVPADADGSDGSDGSEDVPADGSDA